jgi:hypothetical protein
MSPDSNVVALIKLRLDIKGAKHFKFTEFYFSHKYFKSVHPLLVHTDLPPKSKQKQNNIFFTCSQSCLFSEHCVQNFLNFYTSYSVISISLG